MKRALVRYDALRENYSMALGAKILLLLFYMIELLIIIFFIFQYVAQSVLVL